MSVELDALAGALDPIGLDAVEARASLQTRRDRKYVVDPATLTVLVGELAPIASVLEIDGRRVFGYESVYFDTPEADAYLGAAHRRPRRFKVRTRRYVDGGECWVEVKLRDRLGRTRKARRTHAPDHFERLTAHSLEFVAGFDRVRPHVSRLAPVVRTAYRRATLVVGGQRVTIDVEVRCDDLADRVCGLGDRVIVETKSPAGPGLADRTLWRLGSRPITISKFAIGMATFRPDLPTNKWHRALDLVVVPGHSPTFAVG